MLPSLQRHLRTQYWGEFHQSPHLSLLMGRMSTRSRSFWIQIGWENISNTRSLTKDMERNTMNGCSGMIYLRTLVQNHLRTMSHNSTPNIPQQSTIQMKSGSEQRDEGLSRKDKKTYSET